jgi:prepilin-type processing-associated H-X9-DG protein
LLYGETTATRWQGEFESEDISWMAGGGLGTYLGLGRSRTAILTQFSGWHPNGVLFCFADGSVRIIRYGKTQREFGTEHSHDWYLLQELAGYRDGMNSDVSSILD